MEFRETIRRRRMVRNYQSLPVSAQAVERIVTAGLSAPSAGNSQGQSLVVVTDAPVRARIARLAGEHRYSGRGFDPWISGAPVHIVVCVSADAYRRRYREPDKGATGAWPVPYWWVDGGATLMAVLLASVDEGLAAGFLGAHSIPGLSRLLGIPEDTAPLGVVTIGRPAADRPSGSLARGRRPRSETVHYQRWGNGA